MHALIRRRPGGHVRAAPARILVADGFKPWRQSVRSLLEGHAELWLVGEAVDGLEAVQKARELKPDLILLAIELAHLHGLEAAKQIHKIVPGATILFLTLHNETDVMQAALDIGAKGYVLKVDAGSELWPAIETVLHGQPYISSGLAGRVPTSP